MVRAACALPPGLGPPGPTFTSPATLACCRYPATIEEVNKGYEIEAADPASPSPLLLSDPRLHLRKPHVWSPPPQELWTPWLPALAWPPCIQLPLTFSASFLTLPGSPCTHMSPLRPPAPTLQTQPMIPDELYCLLRYDADPTTTGREEFEDLAWDDVFNNRRVARRHHLPPLAAVLLARSRPAAEEPSGSPAPGSPAAEAAAGAAGAAPLAAAAESADTRTEPPPLAPPPVSAAAAAPAQPPKEVGAAGPAQASSLLRPPPPQKAAKVPPTPSGSVRGTQGTRPAAGKAAAKPKPSGKGRRRAPKRQRVSEAAPGADAAEVVPSGPAQLAAALAQVNLEVMVSALPLLDDLQGLLGLSLQELQVGGISTACCCLYVGVCSAATCQLPPPKLLVNWTAIPPAGLLLRNSKVPLTPSAPAEVQGAAAEGEGRARGLPVGGATPAGTGGGGGRRQLAATVHRLRLRPSHSGHRTDHAVPQADPLFLYDRAVYDSKHTPARGGRP